MKLYVAGAYAAGFGMHGNLFDRLTTNEKWQRCHVPHILESYHYLATETKVNRVRRDGIKIFLDSGAFSAYTMGISLDLGEYCDYIKQYEDIIEKVDGTLVASVLDGIGDPQKTYENQQAMERLGVRPLPCFHYGEDTRYLDHYVANYDYITIGGMVPITKPQLYLWLQGSDTTQEYAEHGNVAIFRWALDDQKEFHACQILQRKRLQRRVSFTYSSTPRIPRALLRYHGRPHALRWWSFLLL